MVIVVDQVTIVYTVSDSPESALPLITWSSLECVPQWNPKHVLHFNSIQAQKCNYGPPLV